MMVALNICRFDPEVDRERYIQKFEVELESHRTVLDALLCAREQDPSLSFRRSCRSAICGSCAVWLDSRPVLACHTLIRDVAGGTGMITVEPLPHFRQIKDLVVDLEPFFESLKVVVPWVWRRSPE
jgi:succinate dehydrogenase / fumarate reductase iron-sulfur subunit